MLSTPISCPMAGAMASTLCAASKKVSAQKKKKNVLKQNQSPQKKVIYSGLQNPLIEESKIHICTPSNTKPRHNLGPLVKTTYSF